MKVILSELLFADDQVLIVDTYDNLQHLISLDQKCKADSMRLSTQKTKVMVIGR